MSTEQSGAAGRTRLAGIYLIVEFEWPRPFQAEHGRLARALHDVVVEQDWIREVVAGSGGVGGGPSSVWIFWLQDYAALDHIVREGADGPVARAYGAFLSVMERVSVTVRGEVVFLPKQ